MRANLNYLVLSLICFLASCNNEPSTVTSFDGIQMTIPYRIQIGEKLTKQDSKKIEMQFSAIFDLVNKKFNKWNPDSEVSTLNLAKAYEEIKISKELYDLMEKSDLAYKVSHGLFDPTSETIIAYVKPFFEKGIYPNETYLNQLESLVSWKNISWKEGVFTKPNTAIQLDFGGIAKGYCVDLISIKLKELGYESSYVEWGGEIRTEGKHPSGRYWNAAIKDPKKDIVIDLKSRSIATSGDENQYYLVHIGNQHVPEIFSHIYNPIKKKFKKVEKGKISTSSVSSKECWFSDALATAACLYSSKEEAQKWLSSLNDKREDIIWFHIQEAPLGSY